MAINVGAASKYQKGDTLLIANYTAEYYRITSITGGDYILQAYYASGEPNGVPFALGIDFVDSNSEWHKKSEIVKYVLIGLGGLALLGVIALASRKS